MINLTERLDKPEMLDKGLVALVCATPGCKNNGKVVFVKAVQPGCASYFIQEVVSGMFLKGFCPQCLRQGRPAKLIPTQPQNRSNVHAVQRTVRSPV